MGSWILLISVVEGYFYNIIHKLDGGRRWQAGFGPFITKKMREKSIFLKKLYINIETVYNTIDVFVLNYERYK
jgi:hypothetical protein